MLERLASPEVRAALYAGLLCFAFAAYIHAEVQVAFAHADAARMASEALGG